MSIVVVAPIEQCIVDGCEKDWIGPVRRSHPESGQQSDAAPHWNDSDPTGCSHADGFHQFSSTFRPKMKIFSSPTSSRISTLRHPVCQCVMAPFRANFIFPVPEASIPAVEICSDKSAAGMIFLGEGIRCSLAENTIFQFITHLGIVIDHLCALFYEFDKQFGHGVTRSGFSGKDDRPQV